MLTKANQPEKCRRYKHKNYLYLKLFVSSGLLKNHGCRKTINVGAYIVYRISSSDV
jgi:hypothetical protein